MPLGQITRRYVVCVPPLGILAAKSAHGVTGVATFILLADIGNQRFRTLHFDFEGGDQRVFRVNGNVSRFPLNFKTDRRLTCVLVSAGWRYRGIDWTTTATDLFDPTNDCFGERGEASRGLCRYFAPAHRVDAQIYRPP